MRKAGSVRGRIAPENKTTGDKMTKKEKFTRADIEKLLHDKAGIDTIQAAAVINIVLDGIAASIAAGVTVELRGLGTFGIRKRKGRKARNPRTGEPVNVPAHDVFFFQACRKTEKNHQVSWRKRGISMKNIPELTGESLGLSAVRGWLMLPSEVAPLLRMSERTVQDKIKRNKFPIRLYLIGRFYPFY